MTDQLAQVFISYKSEDRARLKPLVAALEAEGFSVWWDQHIGGGTNWREEIETHLDAAKVVIVVWSKKTIGPDGRVKEAKVLRSIPLLDQAALDAVKQWQFTPTLLNGVPVPVIMTVTVNFTLQ